MKNVLLKFRKEFEELLELFKQGKRLWSRRLYKTAHNLRAIEVLGCFASHARCSVLRFSLGRNERASANVQTRLALIDSSSGVQRWLA